MSLKDKTRTSGLIASIMALGLTIAACSGQTPTRPAAPTSAPTAAVASSAAPIVMPWSCVMATASAPRAMGIFASARVEQPACGARPLLIDTAAATAPGVPPNLTSSVTGATVTLTWTAPTSADPATSYVIEAGSSAGATNIAVLDTLNAATSFTATGVPAGTYFVRVRARNSAGTSAASNEVVVLVGGGGCTSAPGAPSGLTYSVSGSTVTLTWVAPAGGCAPTGYVIEAGSASGGTNLANFNTGSTATTFSAGGVPNGTYYVRARAANSIGQSAASSEVILTVGGAPPPPGAGPLSGLWQGTITPRLTGNVQADFTQNGTSLTGVVRNRPTGRGMTFQLTQSADPAVYNGTLVFEGTSSGACGAGSSTGSLTVSAGSTAMSGSFTLPASGSCPSETNQVQLTKQ